MDRGVTGIACPECGHNTSKVYDSRPAPHTIRRRRECDQCKARFVTVEAAEQDHLAAIDPDALIVPVNLPLYIRVAIMVLIRGGD